MHVMSVIERLKEQLTLAGKVRGFKKPIYKKERGGKNKVLDHYARQMIEVRCSDILELCGLILNKEDEIYQAQLQGHSFGVTVEDRAAMLADDLFHLIELAELSTILKPSKNP